MYDEDERLYFAGTTAMDQPRIPEWFGASRDIDPETTRPFGEAFRSLHTAQTTDVAWKVPTSVLDDDTSVADMSERAPEGVRFFETWDGEVYATTTSHNAVFSPELLQQVADGEQTDPLYNIPTDSYALVNPYDFYRPLEDALEAAEEGGNVFGEFRIQDRGAEVHGDIWFDTREVGLPHGEGKFKFGIQTGYDFKGNRALYANIIAQDTSCSNTLRQLASKKTRKHVSGEADPTLNASAYEDWWAELLEKIDLVADEMNHVLQDAKELFVTFEVDDPAEDSSLGGDDPLEVPFSLEEFYRLAGVAHVHQAIPEYLRESAAKDTRQRSGTVDTHSMWHIHSGLTYALTHVFRGGERGALLSYNEVAKDLLYNPSQMMQEVAQQYEAEIEDDEEEEAYVRGERGVATIQRSADRLSEMREEFDERQQRLEAMLEDETEAEA